VIHGIKSKYHILINFKHKPLILFFIKTKVAVTRIPRIVVDDDKNSDITT